MFRLCALIAVFLLPISALAHSPDQDKDAAGMAPDAALEKLFADEWQARMDRHPFWASQRGLRDYDALVPDASAEAQQRFQREDQAFLERLSVIDRAGLTVSDA